MNDKFYVNNHLMFKILVHETNGQYTRSKQSSAELEAASAVEVGRVGGGRCWGGPGSKGDRWLGGGGLAPWAGSAGAQHGCPAARGPGANAHLPRCLPAPPRPARSLAAGGCCRTALRPLRRARRCT